MTLLPKFIAVSLAGLTFAIVASTASVTPIVEGTHATATPKHRKYKHTPTPTATPRPTRTPAPFAGYTIHAAPVLPLAPASQPKCNGCHYQHYH